MLLFSPNSRVMFILLIYLKLTWRSPATWKKPTALEVEGYVATFQPPCCLPSSSSAMVLLRQATHPPRLHSDSSGSLFWFPGIINYSSFPEHLLVESAQRYAGSARAGASSLTLSRLYHPGVHGMDSSHSRASSSAVPVRANTFAALPC